VLAVYYAACARVMGGSVSEIARNVTLANSAWTAERMRALCPEVDVSVVHPPVLADFPDVPWARRENGFVCIGRIAGEKQLDRVVSILAAVRPAVPDVHLHVIGSRGGRADYRRFMRLARHHRQWVHVSEDLSRAELAELVARHRYGIHGMQEEHFGIAPAEMTRAGCIVFLPAGGGQVEIVGGDDRLLYSQPDEAVAKIVQVLTHAEDQASLRTYLAGRAGLFSAERFVGSIREVVHRFPDPLPQDGPT